MQFRLIPLALVLLSCCATPAFAGRDDGRLDIYWIDVEAGAATLVVTPTGETVLIDTGNPGFRDADRIVKVLTGPANRRRIDHLVITHYHGDHYGGASTLATLVPIGAVYDNGVFEGMPDDPGKAYFTFKCEERKVVQPGQTIPLQKPEDGETPLTFTFLGARKQFIEPPKDRLVDFCRDAREKERDGSDNANSVVMSLQFGPFRFFDAGDLTWNQETRLVCPVNLVGEVDVYQVTHHGLDSSNNPLVLRALEPRVAVMNNGVTKGCMPEVFDTLKHTPSLEAIYQVHKNLRPDGAVNNVADEFIANLAEKCQANHIHLSVAADGKEYTVAIPANGHKRTYASKSQ
jgi:beta-lactamase superfamily II metal-dependent hydrolase